MTRLEEIDRDETVQLSMAGDLIMFLIERILGSGRVKRIDDRVKEVAYDSQVSRTRGRSSQGREPDAQSEMWTASLRSGEPVPAKQIHLCTGSYPIVASLHEKHNPKVKALELDEVLRKSRIPNLLGLESKDRAPALSIGVIGNSHSGVLAIRNLYEVAQEHKLDMTILSFERRPILYAEYRDDGIVHDNTGLKGATADWSKDVMESEWPGNGKIRRIHLGRSKEEEDKVYGEWFPRCTHLVYAIGYHRNPTPRIRVDALDVTDEIDFDMHSSGFKRRAPSANGKVNDTQVVPRLFGCGIAFPEEVEDPAGNVEAAVGVAKFYKFAERVGPLWVK